MGAADLTGASVVGLDAERKAFANLQANAALRGYSLTRSTETNGRTRFVIGKWNLLRFCDSLAEVERFLGLAGIATE